MESKAYFINLPVSPKKVRFYLPAIKKLKPINSLDYLYYERTDAAGILYKAIKSAISNARQLLKVEDNLLNFKLLTVEQGQKLKRFRPGSRGNAKPINRRMSHIKIILEAKAEKKVESKIEKKETKELKSKVKSQSSKVQVKNKK
ncbi:MAG: uL22 family ribosomal protein [Candidatus Roizmanbacteria bacterium]|nr:uL22 family ribosomal protein [Candidatus Roizmanbacteria bacterium]